MKVRVTRPFKFSPDGCAVVEYEKGVQDLPERAVEVALQEGWAVTVGQKAKPSRPDEDPPAEKPDDDDPPQDPPAAEGGDPRADPPEDPPAEDPNATGNIVDRLKAKVTGKK